MVGYRQKGVHQLKKWRYYERNFPNMESDIEYLNAYTFLSTLRLLDRSDVELLAERYYNVEEKTRTNVIPVSYATIAGKLNRSEKSVKDEICWIEERVGNLIQKDQPKNEVRIAKDKLKALEEYAISSLSDEYEQTLLKLAFIKIKENRTKA